MKPHREALEAAITAAGDRVTAADGPLLELARSLADQVDATGADGPGTRLAGTYLTTLRTLASRLGTPTHTPSGRLADLRSLRDRPAPSKKRRPA